MALDKIKTIAKAVVGFVTPGVVAAVAAVQDGSPGGNAITMPEWVGIVAAMVITGGAVFAVPNKTKPTATDARNAELLNQLADLRDKMTVIAASPKPEPAEPQQDEEQPVADAPATDAPAAEPVSADATPAPAPTPEPAPAPAPAEDPVKAQLKAQIEQVRVNANQLNDQRAAAAKAAVDASA